MKYGKAIYMIIALSLLLAPAFLFAADSTDDKLQLTEEEKIFLEQHPTVRIRISPAYPPFEYYSKEHYQGLAVDYLNLVSRKLGIRFEPSDPSMSWSEALDRIKRKEGIDIILLITSTPEREAAIAFTENYIAFPLVIFNRKDGDFLSGIQDLKNRTVAVEQDFIFSEWLRRDVPDIRFVTFPSSEAALKAVATGKADAYIGNLAVGSYLSALHGFMNLRVAAPTPYDLDALAMGVRKDWPHMTSIINKALASISDEEHRTLRAPWLTVRYEHGIRLSEVLLWVTLIIGISLLFIVQLRRLVRARTRHLEAEIARRIKTEQELTESRTRYKTLIDNLPIGVNMIDPDYMILMSNETMGKWFAKDRNLFAGQYCFSEFEKRSSVCEHCPGTVSMKTGKLAIAETEGIRDDGSRFAVRIRTVPLGAQGKPAGFIELVEDISDIKRVREEKVRAEEQLLQAQKMEAIGTLAGGIAHDFNNILSPIIGYTEMAASLAEGNTQLAEYLRHVTDAAARATDLVRQILTFSRKSDQQLEPLQIALIVKEALKLLRSSIPTTIEIRQDIKTRALVLADPTQIHQIVMNLCTNAYQAMEQTGGVLSVSLTDTELSAEINTEEPLEAVRHVVLEVSDTGSGMDEDTKAKIFEPYFTTKGQGKGTGLGLAVVHGIVKDHHGRITVWSEPGRGTTFRVFLPATEAVSEKPPEQHEEAAPTKRHEHILFVDDEARICTMTRDYLSGYGYVVEVCSNGRDALFALEQNPYLYDLLITDMTMPGINGRDLSKKVLAVRPDLPIIICTGYSSLIDREEAGRIGIRSYIEKPFSMRTLMEKIRDTLDSAAG